MLDGSIPTSRVVAVALWVAVALLIVTSWALALAGEHPWGQIVGLTACATSAAAATAHVGCFAMRLSAGIRANRLAIGAREQRPGEGGDEVHRLY